MAPSAGLRSDARASPGGRPRTRGHASASRRSTRPISCPTAESGDVVQQLAQFFRDYGRRSSDATISIGCVPSPRWLSVESMLASGMMVTRLQIATVFRLDTTPFAWPAAPPGPRRSGDSRRCLRSFRPGRSTGPASSPSPLRRAHFVRVRWRRTGRPSACAAVSERHGRWRLSCTFHRLDDASGSITKVPRARPASLDMHPKARVSGGSDRRPAGTGPLLTAGGLVPDLVREVGVGGDDGPLRRPSGTRRSARPRPRSRSAVEGEGGRHEDHHGPLAFMLASRLRRTCRVVEGLGFERLNLGVDQRHL